MSSRWTAADVRHLPGKQGAQARAQLDEQDAAAVERARAKCPTCFGKGTIPSKIRKEGKMIVHPPDIECPSCGPRGGPKAVEMANLRQMRSWSAAKKTVVDEITFASRMEAQVYTRLRDELRVGELLYRQYPIALTNLAPGSKGEVLRFTCDFLILQSDGQRRFVEAKGTRRSRDYPVRFAAATKLVGKIEEVDR